MILPEPNQRLMTYEHRGVWVIVSRLFAGGTQTCTRKKLPDLRVGERCVYFWGGASCLSPCHHRLKGAAPLKIQRVLTPNVSERNRIWK